LGRTLTPLRRCPSVRLQPPTFRLGSSDVSPTLHFPTLSYRRCPCVPDHPCQSQENRDERISGCTEPLENDSARFNGLLYLHISCSIVGPACLVRRLGRSRMIRPRVVLLIFRVFSGGSSDLAWGVSFIFGVTFEYLMSTHLS